VNKSYKNEFEELKKIPKTSGIYYFYDEDDIVIYVGKASSLYARALAHFKNHSIDREIGFFIKNISSKGYSIHEEEKLPKELLDNWKRLKERGNSSTALVIDVVFDKVKRIEIEEMPEELTKSKEKEMIEKFQPIYNAETNSLDYNDIRY